MSTAAVRDADLVDILAVLSDPARAESARTFPHNRIAASQAGLYSWWADVAARDALSATLESPLPPLIYAGQTGATKWPSGKQSKGSLKARIGNLHIRGGLRGSTFRITLAALLLEPLGLRLIGPKLLDSESNARLTEWICDHLSVAIYPIADRNGLGVIEAAVLSRLDPPLNLDGMPWTAARGQLSQLRKLISRGSFAPPIGPTVS